MKDHGGDEGPQVEGSTQPAGDDLNPDGAFVGRELLNVGRARTEIGEEMIEILRKTAYNAEHPTFLKIMLKKQIIQNRKTHLSILKKKTFKLITVLCFGRDENHAKGEEKGKVGAQAT